MAAWKVPALALAGLTLVSLTAVAGGHSRPVGGRVLGDAAPVSALVSAPVSAPGAAPYPAPDPAGADVASTATRSARTPRLDPRWLARTALAVGVPAPALRAYARAALGSPPACALGWTTLAGIGWVESQHGTLGGRVLHADGRSSSPIIGPTLDGTGNVAAIPASAAGAALHGDVVWDHAVGPLQFLSSTWDSWARDGDGDRAGDPQDLDDAAAAAAAYLCAEGRHLTGTGWSAGVLSYNHDADYVRLVFAAAQAYADRAR